MKEVKVIFIAVEIAALISVVSLAFCDIQDEEMKLFKSLYITVCAILAVTMQKEQQDIDWDEEQEELL